MMTPTPPHSASRPSAGTPSREQILAWMRELGLDAPGTSTAREHQVLSLAERLTGQRYVSATHSHSARQASAPSSAPSSAHVSPGSPTRPEPAWIDSEGAAAADGFVRRMAASLEGGRRRVETLYRINHLAAIVRAEGYSYSEREIETMRRLSHRHLPALFRVQLLHRAAQREDSIGLRARIEIARTLLREGLLKEVAQDRFLVSFGFGSRDFDALFEMGDGGPVREALVQAAQNDAALAEHLGALGWDGVGSPQQAAQAPAVRPRG